MSVTAAMFWTGVAVVGGKWTQNKGLDLKAGVAVIFLTMMLMGLSSVNEDLASAFATLILIGAVLFYAAKPIAERVTGLTK